VGLSYAELMKLNTKIRAENRALEKRMDYLTKTFREQIGGGFIPGVKIFAWREECFQISCALDLLRESMRKVLNDVESFPKKS